MSFFDDASLAFLPSSGAGKDGKAYSIKPTNGDGDFTFSRGSNLAATRVGADGLIEKGRENLALYSNDFNQWSTNVTTLTSSQTGYDGSSDAWLLTKSGANGFVYRGVSQSGIQTISVYAKANTNSWMQIYVVGTSNIRTYFDLGNGTLGAYAFNVIDRSIEDVGNGWYRCSVVFSNSTSQVRFFVSDGNNNDTGTSGSIYIQDAQLEIGLAATDYIESGATTGKAGLLEDEPRFDYSGGATCPSLLLEGSRTQSVPYSEYFGSSYYNLAGGPVLTTNYGISPEGLINSSRIDAPAANGGWYTDGKSVAIGETHTCSIFAKLVSGSTSNIVRFGFSLNGDKLTRYDLSDGTIDLADPNTTSSIEDYGNGWYRLIQTITTTTSGTLREVLYSYTQAVDYEIFGHQVEQGSYPTSYIPNHSGGSVTRGAEGQGYGGLSSLLGQTEGTLFLDIENAENVTEIFSLNRSTANSIFLRAVSNVYGTYIWSDGTIYAPNTLISVNDRIKIAIAYQSNNFAIYANGVQVSTNNSLTWTPNITIDSLNFNRGGYISSKGVARYNQVLLFKERLSNADLETLTTL